MIKSIKMISDSIISTWSEEYTKKSYPFMEDISDLIDEFKVVATKVTEDRSTKVKTIIFYTLNNVHRLLVEIRNGVIIGQRISLNSLNRSIVENYIILNFIQKYGEDAADLYIANSEIAFQKLVKKVNNGLSKEEIGKIDEIIIKTKQAHKKVKFNNGYMWANSFLETDRNHKPSIFDIANNLGINDDYDRLSLFHQQSHSSSGLAHLMNITEHDNLLIYTSKIINSVVYMSKTLDCVCDEPILNKYNDIHNKVITKYDELVITINNTQRKN